MPSLMILTKIWRRGPTIKHDSVSSPLPQGAIVDPYVLLVEKISVSQCLKSVLEAEVQATAISSRIADAKDILYMPLLSTETSRAACSRKPPVSQYLLFFLHERQRG